MLLCFVHRETFSSLVSNQVHHMRKTFVENWTQYYKCKDWVHENCVMNTLFQHLIGVSVLGAYLYMMEITLFQIEKVMEIPANMIWSHFHFLLFKQEKS